MVSYTESFDTSTPMGRAMIGIVGVFAQLERELTGERVSAAMLARAQKGKRTCSEILGYDLKGKDSFVINKKEAEYVRFCFENISKEKIYQKWQACAVKRDIAEKEEKSPMPGRYPLS